MNYIWTVVSPKTEKRKLDMTIDIDTEKRSNGFACNYLRSSGNAGMERKLLAQTAAVVC